MASSRWRHFVKASAADHSDILDGNIPSRDPDLRQQLGHSRICLFLPLQRVAGHLVCHTHASIVCGPASISHAFGCAAGRCFGIPNTACRIEKAMVPRRLHLISTTGRKGSHLHVQPDAHANQQLPTTIGSVPCCSVHGRSGPSRRVRWATLMHHLQSDACLRHAAW